MPIARVDVMVQDPQVSASKGEELTELKKVHDDFFLDGPVSRRVAVVDFDPVSGALVAPARWVAPPPDGKEGHFDVSADDFESPQFMQVNVFGTVHQAIGVFEDENALGRHIPWAFDHPQLLIVPRAGSDANAYYERSSRSLQFFAFESDTNTHIFTCLSRDIVAHEAGHALLDGVVPSLYDAITPQALALHECIGDLTALLLTLESRRLREVVLDRSGLRIDGETAISAIAEQFGSSLDPSRHSLRSFVSDRTLADVHDDEPHDLAEVLDACAYAVLVSAFDRLKQRGIEAGKTPRAAAGQALALAREQFARMFLRAIDHLPPGEVTFADFARAVLAADTALYPDDGTERAAFVRELVARGVATADELDVVVDFTDDAIAGVDLDALARSDFAAYRFADANRALLAMPASGDFQVLPRITARKTVFSSTDDTGDDSSAKRTTEDLLFKVTWRESEANAGGIGGRTKRVIDVGTTLAIDPATRRVRTLLTTDRSGAARAARDRFVARLGGSGALAASSSPHTGSVVAETTADAVRFRSTARLLHIRRHKEP